MPGGTVGTFLDETTLDALNAVVEVENRPKSQVLGVALRAFLALSPGARRVMFTVDGMADEEERAFAMKAIGRAALQAYERILDSRQQTQGPVRSGNAALDSEEAIEAEAVRMSRR
jgi:hypothetical protein